MDGVDPEHNIQDTLSDVWVSDEEIEQVEALANNFVLGNPLAGNAFFRAGGSSVNLSIALDHDFLRWFGGMLKRIYTRALPGLQSDLVILPLNPFRVIQNALDSVYVVWISMLSPEPDFPSVYFGANFQLGACIIPYSLV